MQELFDHALAFAYQPLLQGDRICIVTNAGGPGILATDALETAGMELARITPEIQQEIKAFLPGAASVANPIDVLGDAMSDRYEFALRKVVEDPNVDGILVLLTPQAMSDIEATAHIIGQLSGEADKPILGLLHGRISRGTGHRYSGGIWCPELFLPGTRRREPSPPCAIIEKRAIGMSQKIPQFESNTEQVKNLFAKVRQNGRVFTRRRRMPRRAGSLFDP